MAIAEKILKVVEPIVFGNRPVALAVLAVLTLFFGWQASHTKIDAGFEKALPLEHPYMKTFKKYQEAFGGANVILVSVVQDKSLGPDIYNEKFLATLKGVTDEVFFLPGIDRARVASLFTPNTRYLEVVEGGFSGGNVVPADYAPSPDMFALVKSHVAKAGIIGRLVTVSQNGAMVTAELLERDPVTHEKLDYQKVAHDLEKIRQKYEREGIKIQIVGFAKAIGDITDAAGQVVMFFGIALVLTVILLWIYCGSLKLSLLPLGCTLVAVVWEFGLLTVFHYGLDPYAILVPFLVLSVGVSHGVQMISTWGIAVADDKMEKLDAAKATFRRLLIPGTAALVTNVIGFGTILMIHIQIIQEMAINAMFGIAAIVITNKVLMPIMLSYVKLGNVEAFRQGQLRREAAFDNIWHFLAKFTERNWAIGSIAVASVLLGWSIFNMDRIQIGDVTVGVPELRPNSRYNQDSRTINENYTIGTDILKVIAEGVPEGCISYDVMENMDRFAWRMTNTPGVASTISLPQIAKIVNSGWNEGSLKWRIVPRNKFVIVQATSPVDTSYGLFNPDCSAMPVIVFTTDHKATTISAIVAEVKRYNDENANPNGWKPPDDPDKRKDWKAPEPGTPEYAKGPYLNFSLATGNVGVMAATNEVIKDREKPILYWVYFAITLCCWLAFRSIAATICVMLPLVLVSLMAYGVMAIMGIGLKVATLPVAAFAVGIGVDYGIYIYSTLSAHMSEGVPLKEAYFRALHYTGKAVLFTALTLASSVATWLMSELQFQADMGLLLVFMFVVNMLGAILLFPALAHFLLEGRKITATLAH